MGGIAWMFACLSGALGAEPTYGDPKLPVAGSVLGTTIHTRDAEELRYVVLGRLLEAFAKEKDISVKAEEITAYRKAMEEGMAADRAEKQAAKNVLKRRMAAAGLPKTERQALEKELALIEQFLADTAPDKTPQTAEDKQALEQIASAFIKHWKVNRALQASYGGRIGYQQGGPEPLDATRRFLEERKQRGDFTIASKALEDAFWSYYQNDSLHDFYKPGSKEETQAFSSQPWAPKK